MNVARIKADHVSAIPADHCGRERQTGAGPSHEDGLPYVRQRRVPEADGFGLLLAIFLVVLVTAKVLLPLAVVGPASGIFFSRGSLSTSVLFRSWPLSLMAIGRSHGVVSASAEFVPPVSSVYGSLNVLLPNSPGENVHTGDVGLRQELLPLTSSYAPAKSQASLELRWLSVSESLRRGIQWPNVTTSKRHWWVCFVVDRICLPTGKVLMSLPRVDILDT